MINAPQISIFTTDANLIVRSWDSWLAEVTGIDSNTACGQSLTTLIPDLESRGLLLRFQQVLTAGVIETLAPSLHQYLIPCPVVVSSKYFDRMQQRVTIAPWREGDRIVGTVVTIEDVTARLEQERDQGSGAVNAQPIETRNFASLQSLSFAPSLGNESWRVRQQAVNNIVQQEDQSITPSLLRAMREQHRNPSVLNSVLQVMALSNIDVIEPLIEFLHGQDVDLRIYAALALGEQQDPRAIPALLSALSDPDINVRYHAIDALGYLRANQVVEALLNIAVSGDFFLAFAALEALRRIGDPTVAPRLVPLLTNEMLSESVVTVLTQISDEEVVTPLGQLLNTELAPVNAIAQILCTVYEHYQNIYREGCHIADLAQQAIAPSGIQNLLDALPQTKPEELRAVVIVLSWLADPVVERTLTNLLGQPTVRKDVVEALVRHGNSVTELLVEQLEAEDVETRHAAVVALGRIGDARAVPALNHLLTVEGKIDPDEFSSGYEEETSSSHSLVIAAAEAVAQIGDRGAFEVLLSLIGHPQAAVRQAAIAALDSLGHPAMPSRLLTLLQDTNPLVRESAVKIAGYFAYPECVDLLFERCQDQDDRVLRAAIEHIPYLEDNRVMSTLVAAIHSTQPKVRAAAARAFAHIDSQEAFPYLLAALEDPDPWVRYYAVRSIGRHGYAETLAPLAQVVQQDEAQQVKAAAIEVLGQIGGARAVTTLAALAVVEDKDIELSRAAVLALGQIGHPDALPPLITVLRSPLPQRRMDALTALGTRGRSHVADTLQWVAVSDRESYVAQAAIDALIRVGTPEAIAALIELTAEPTRRDAAVAALAQFGTQIEAVAQGLEHPNTGVRRAVIEALTRLKNQRASELLSNALSDTDGLVRLAAVSALSRLGNRSAERKLAMMARNDPDMAVRRAAQKAIQNT